MTSGGAEPLKLLLVDDKAENLVALEAILKDPGYQLLTARTGEEALKLALREQLAVILLDVVMPGMDGFEVARTLKQLERTREVPILFLTALATDVQQIYRAYDVGAVDYLIKPLDAPVVRRKVGVFADLVRQREQLERQAEALREADRREYELKLAELRVAGDRRYQKLVEGIDHAIGWSADESLRFTFISRQAAQILGYPQEQFLDPGFWAAHLHPEDRPLVLSLFQEALAQGTEHTANHRIVTAEGRTRWFHTAVSGERVPGSEVRELHGISVEVTDLKHAEEEARRATHLREEFLAIVAHDLRGPLGSIRLGAGLLARMADGGTELPVGKTAQTIIRSSERMERLISDLLDFALIQAERLTVERQVVDAGEFIRESLELFGPLAAERQIRLEGGGGTGLRLDVDRDRLLQILSNLVGNAIKFTPEQGSVRLRLEHSGTEALFVVSDTGRGMSADELSRMWGRYWQAKRKPDGGVGLGLFISKALVEAHGGRIWAESKPELGTSFYFTMPLAPPAEAQPGSAGPPDLAANNSRTPA